MKAKYLFLSMMSVAFAGVFSSCGSDNDDSFTMPQKPEVTPLALAADTVSMGIGETTTLEINTGAGDYKVINENPDIVTGEMNGNTLTITSSKKGLTGLVVSDGGGNYKRIVVRSMYQEIAFAQDQVNLETKLGHAVRAQVLITKGNGQYTYVSDNPDVANLITIVGDSVAVVSGKKTGTANIEITDVMGLKKTLVVNVTATEEPYTAKEKEEIMSSSVQRFVWEGYSRTISSQYNAVMSKAGNTYTYGWEYVIWGTKYYWATLNFTGDLTVGQKESGTLNAKVTWGLDEATYNNVKVEILKNDGKNIWATMSTVDNDYLYYGFFCMPVQ